MGTARLVTVIKRLPVTTALLVLVLVLSILTRALWEPMGSRALGSSMAYGLPSFQHGAWWTVATGSVFAVQPVQYLPILLGLALLGGFAEWRLGTRQAAVALVCCHVVAVVATAALLWVSRDHGYLWPTLLADDLDAGPSAAFLGAVAAASVTLTPPWRGRLRAALVAYVLLLAVHMGALADLEHVIAVGLGLLIGPLLQRRPPRFSTRRLTRRDYRLLASGFFVIAALEAVIQDFTTEQGPLAVTLSAQARVDELSHRSLVGAVILGMLWLCLGRSLYKGRRRAWFWGVSLLTVVIGIQIASLVWMVVVGEPGLVAASYDLVLNIAGLGLLLVGRQAFRNPSPRRARRTLGSLIAPADDVQRKLATELLCQEGTVNRLAWMTTWPENRWFTTSDRAGYVAYRVHAGVAVGLCDPIAAAQGDRAALLVEFADRVHAQGMVPCLFTVSAEASEHARSQGWHSLQVAEEAVIELANLDFVGKAWQDVRTALNQAARHDIHLELGPLARMPRGLQMQVKAISSAWVEDKGLPEMGFTLGGVDEALDANVRVGLAVDADRTVHGLTSWMPIHDVGGGEPVGWTLDVMRRLPGGFRYTMEFLIASACQTFRDEGCSIVSLSGAPLARSAGAGGGAGPDLDPGTLDAFLDRLGATLEPYYGFRSLHAFKAKFQPRTEPLYLVFPDEAALPRIGLALSRAYLPEAGLRDLVTLARA